MHDLTLLKDLLILVAFAIPSVALAERVGVPAIVAFLLVGVAIGPHGLALIGRVEDVKALAELGVVLLLFEIGLELSVARIARMRTIVLVGGTLQVALTIGAVTAVGVLAGATPHTAIAFGFLVTLSSTAIVLKIYRERADLDTPHGRVVLGILIFQDLAVVPLMVVLPFLSDSGGPVTAALGRVALALGVLAAVVLAGRVLVPHVLERVSALRNHEIFTLTVAFIGLGAAFATASVGLSLAIGAFVAGLVVSESEYAAAALSDVLPFRAVFSGIFFTSVGMLLDIGFVYDRAALVAGVAAGVVIGKGVINTAIVAIALRRSLVTSVVAGLGLAQIGEFSFVLAGVAVAAGLMSDPIYQVFLAATVLSMIATPFLIQLGPALARLVGRSTTLKDPLGQLPAGKTDHTIIVGYGLSGRHLASVLKAAHLPYVILEVNGLTVRRAREEHEPIFFGDGTRRETLEQVGITDARTVIFNISSPNDERRGVAVARELNPTARIIVRTRTVAAIADLERLGASDVIVEEYEAALELFERVMDHYHIPANTIAAELDAVRSAHYGILRGVPTEELRLDELKYLGIHHALQLVEVEEGSQAVGENAVTLSLRRETGATVVAVVRDAVAHYDPAPGFRYQPGDVVVLVGAAPALLQGAEMLRAAR
jgi:CPA2 family monovalent cation:H+ antiporter-2